MSDADASVLGCCGICLYAALDSWCITRTFGADGCRCCGPRGCCGSCCNPSFDEDDFDQRMKKEQEKNGVNSEPVSSQPAPSGGMSEVPGNPEPTTVEVQ